MITVNDTPSSPLRYIHGDITIGQFYNSVDQTYHLSIYVPYKTPPTKYLCGGHRNFSPSREDRPDRKKCSECWAKLKDLSNEE